MAKLRAGILSMQRIYNYGSFLQAYGLKSILEELGCDVEFVDYVPEKCLVKSFSSNTGVARKLEKVLEVLRYDACFTDKIRYIRYKRTYGERFYPLLGIDDSQNLNPTLDLLVIGSDEVFNCVQDNANVGFTPALFGYGFADVSRKISYAASFGNTTLVKLEKFGVDDKVAEWLSKLDAISVRDENSGTIVRDLTDAEPNYNLDPVLAYDYMGKCNKIPAEVGEREEYMILYGYSGRLSSDECKSVRAYADTNGLKVINIGGIQGCCDQFVDCNPFEVLAYFKSARCVVTDTFHGTIFSTITETPFATIVRKEGYGNSEKLTDLLRRLGLSNRAIDKPGDLNSILAAPIEWEAVCNRIDEGRRETYCYLEKEVGKCTLS